MAYASREGRARADVRSPKAAGQCDRCGFIYQFDHLRWQMDYSGAGIYNKRILVCEKCYDTPQQQLKVIVIPPDPMPILNARPPDYIYSETNYRLTYNQPTIDPITGLPVSAGDYRITQNNNNRVTQQTGEPIGGLNQLPGTDCRVPANEYDGTEIGLPYNNDSVPFTGPLYPPYNYIVQWNNKWNFGILNGTYWANDFGGYVNWKTTIL